jgi:hypothetical protein
MAIFKFTSTNSVFNFINHAFAEDPLGPDTLIVEAGGYLIATGGNFSAAFLNPNGAWTVTVNGTMLSYGGFGIVLDFGNTGVSTITVGASGSIGGAINGINAASPAVITNAGVIAGVFGDGIAIGGAGAHTITNSGIIRGADFSIVDLDGLSNDTVTNSGTLVGRVNLGGGNDTLKNSGGIEVTSGPPVVELGEGNNKLVNSGTIELGITAGSGNDTISNSGKIAHSVMLGDGTNQLTNSGTIAGDVIGGSGADTVTDFAIVGDVIKSGTITGLISLGAGNDKFTGGANPEIVQDGDGADTVSLGGGNDTYIATNIGADGIDIVGGGPGTDTYDASGAAGSVLINLDIVGHFDPTIGFVEANTVRGLFLAREMVFNFENVSGSDGDDIIHGSAVANKLSGNAGGDTLNGYGGNDTLVGGPGEDRLFGGGGKDILSGGPDSDQFQFAKVTDSGVTKATRDVITDFANVDKIDLHLIDANTKLPGDQAFHYINGDSNLTPAANFTSTPGELRSIRTVDGQTLEGDVNGDGTADFAIELFDPTHATTLVDGVFSL